MLNLLKFEFRRLFKSLFFKIIGGYCIVWPLIVTIFYRIIFNISMTESGLTFRDFSLSTDERRLLTWILSVAFVNELPRFLALFACLHIGRDFTDGIVRNKITAGHSRTSIFFSYMITQVTATISFSIIYVCASLLGLLICGIGVDVNGGEMFIRYAVAISTLLVMTVAFVSLSLVFRRRALPIIFSIILVMVMSTATSVIGNFNMPSKAVDDYIEERHENYEDMVDAGILTDDQVDVLEEEFDRDYYLGIPWKICHPSYLVTTLGFNGDYSTDPLQMLLGSPEYRDELDFSSRFVNGYFNEDMSSLTPKDLKHIDSMHVSYDTLNLIYSAKSLFWILAIGGPGYYIFRKKNLF